MVWDIKNPQCNESKKIVWEVAPYLRGRGVDIGAGDFKILPHAISVDNMHHVAFGFQHKPDVIADASKLDIFGSASMDWVYSSHTLEHVEDMEATLKEWWRIIRPGGHLVMYLPHKDFYPNIGQSGANPDHKRDFVPSDVIAAMPDGWDLLENQDRNEDQEYSFLLVFKKRNDKRNTYVHAVSPGDRPRALLVRYGAFGDVLQASSVIKGLKDQGYHVTLHCSPPGSDVIAHDPNIDKIILFDKDQIPNHNLGDFWTWQKKKYNLFVNLSESVEGSLLAMPGRAQYGWLPEARHQMMNRNYLEFQHALAGVPHVPQVKFFPTDEERTWAKKIRSKMGEGPVVMWALAGSSIHKTWAGLDNILASLMVQFPTCNVVLVGGPECVILEQGWEKESRIHKTSGKWSIRQTLTFLGCCDMVIGPETGVLNAASQMPMPKVVFLSHSTVDNLTRDWVDTSSLSSASTHCRGRGDNQSPACHMMLYNWDQCSKDEETGTAKCQAEISVEDVWNAVASKLYRDMRLKDKAA